jgi:class 3 adenylate cyclase
VALSNTMTLLFTDLVGSTAMGDRLGDDLAEQIRRRFFSVIEEAVEPTGGRIVKTLGDGHMVAFASALDAIGCAIAIQSGVDAYNSEGGEPIAVRIGINAGDVTVEGEDYFGTPVTIAKRLCDSAQGGQILVSGLVESLVGSRGGFAFRTLGSLELRGLSRPQVTSEVVWRGEGPPPGVPASGRSRRRLAIGAGAVLVAAAVVAGVLLGTGDDGDPAPSAARSSAPGTGGVTGSRLLDLAGELPTLDSSRDFDFEAEAGDTIRVDAVRGQRDVDLVLELRSPDGSLVAFDDDSGPGSEPQIVAELPESGSYSAVVRMFAPESNGDFRLTVSRVAGSGGANPPERSYGEFTDPGGRFELPVALEAGERIDVVTMSESVNRADLFLELVGPDGSVAESDDDSGENADPVVHGFEVPAAGTWTVRIRPVEDADVGAFWVEVRRY